MQHRIKGYTEEEAQAALAHWIWDTEDDSDIKWGEVDHLIDIIAQHQMNRANDPTH